MLFGQYRTSHKIQANVDITNPNPTTPCFLHPTTRTMFHANLQQRQQRQTVSCSSGAFHYNGSDCTVTVEKLLNLANDLFCHGEQEGALSLYASAISLCRNTLWNVNDKAMQDCELISQQLRWGVEKLQDVHNNEHSLLVTQPDPPDTYHEDECDVGPRPFRLPIFPEAALFSSSPFVGSISDCRNYYQYNNAITITSHGDLVIFYAELLMMYNKSLLHHSRSEYGEATRLYEAITHALVKLLPDLSRPFCTTLAASNPVLYHKLLELYTKVNNNMGQIAYMLGPEDITMKHFEDALLCANHRMGAVSSNTSSSSSSSSSSLAMDALRLDYVTIVSNWCRVHWMNGDINDKVYQGLEEVLRIRSSILGWDHMDVASAHYNLGVAQYARNSSDAALSHFFAYLRVVAKDAEKAKEEATVNSNGLQKTKKQHIDAIPALIYILLVKNEHKDDEISQELVRGLRSLQEKRADVGPQGPEVASILNFIGTLLFHQKDYEHALLFFQEELRLEENLEFHNEDNVSVSVTCNNVARILQELNRLSEAKIYYYRALKTHYGDRIEEWCSQSKGQQQGICPLQWNADNAEGLPPSTVQLYSAVWYNLGLIFDKLGSYGEATKAFKVSLGLRRAMLGPDHADIACLLYNIGVLQMEQEMLQDATLSFREALRIRQVSPAPGHLNDGHVIQTLKKLASLYKAKGNISNALETLSEILDIQKISAATAATTVAESDDDKKDRATKTKEIGTTMRDIAELYHAEGKLGYAVNMAQESINVLRKIPFVAGATPEFVAYTEELVAGLLLLGSLHHENCDPNKATELFREASSMIRQVSTYFKTTTELDAMLEVTEILAACHCAPLA